MKTSPKTKIGLTGGIGCGKSTVAKLITLYGYPVYDSDVSAKWLMNNDTTIRKNICKTFSHKAYDNGVVDSHFISKVVFNSPQKLKELNTIVHSAVMNNFYEWTVLQSSNIVFFESAIIFENNLQHYFDKTIAVLSPIALRIGRVMSRSVITAEEVASRIASQISPEELVPKVDFVVNNNEINALIPQIELILKAIEDSGKNK